MSETKKNTGSADPKDWMPSPTRETHIWWSQYSFSSQKDPCPRCSADEEYTETTQSNHMMYGIKKDRLCKVCGWTWILSIAEDPDD